MTAPDRIWRVAPWNDSGHVNGLVSWTQERQAGEGSTSYTRSDAIPALLAAARAEGRADGRAANDSDEVRQWQYIRHRILALINTLATEPVPEARAYLVRDRATGKERIIDSKKYNPTNPDFWVNEAAMAACDIIPLSALSGDAP